MLVDNVAQHYHDGPAYHDHVFSCSNRTVYAAFPRAFVVRKIDHWKDARNHRGRTIV